MESMHRFTVTSPARGPTPTPSSSFRIEKNRFRLTCSGSLGWRWHDEIALTRVTAGSVRCRSASDSLLLREGDLFFVNAGALHMSAVEPGCGDAEMETILFAPGFIAEAGSDAYARCVAPLTGCHALSLLRLDGPDAWHAEIRRLFDEVCRMDAGCFGYELLCRSRLTELWVVLAAHTREICESAFMPDSQAVNEMRIKKMLAFIERHYQEDLTIDLIAASAGISRSECFRCFKRTIDRKPIEYLTEFRVERAVDMLLNSSLAISDICYRCGFSSPSYFGKVFRSAAGLSPRGYRLKMERMLSAGHEENL